MGQTTAEILTAARDLENRGERVSVRSVRAALGGGDPGTIGRALKEYREDAAAKKTATAQQPALPENVTRTLVEWAGNLVADQAAAAREELKGTSDDNEDLLAQVDALKAQIAELENTLAVTQRERDTTQGALAAVQRQVEEQASELAKERARAADLDQQVANQKAQILAAEETRKEIAELRTQNQLLIERATAAETALKAAASRAEAAEKKAEQADQRARDAEQDATAARIEAAEAKAKVSGAEQKAADAETRAQTALEDNRQLITALAAAQTQAQKKPAAAIEETPDFATAEPGPTGTGSSKPRRSRKTKGAQEDVQSGALFENKG